MTDAVRNDNYDNVTIGSTLSELDLQKSNKKIYEDTLHAVATGRLIDNNFEYVLVPTGGTTELPRSKAYEIPPKDITLTSERIVIINKGTEGTLFVTGIIVDFFTGTGVQAEIATGFKLLSGIAFTSGTEADSVNTRLLEVRDDEVRFGVDVGDTGPFLNLRKFTIDGKTNVTNPPAFIGIPIPPDTTLLGELSAVGGTVMAGVSLEVSQALVPQDEDTP